MFTVFDGLLGVETVKMRMLVNSAQVLEVVDSCMGACKQRTFPVFR